MIGKQRAPVLLVCISAVTLLSLVFQSGHLVLWHRLENPHILQPMLTVGHYFYLPVMFPISVLTLVMPMLGPVLNSLITPSVNVHIILPVVWFKAIAMGIFWGGGFVYPFVMYRRSMHKKYKFVLIGFVVYVMNLFLCILVLSIYFRKHGFLHLN